MLRTEQKEERLRLADDEALLQRLEDMPGPLSYCLRK